MEDWDNEEWLNTVVTFRGHMRAKCYDDGCGWHVAPFLGGDYECDVLTAQAKAHHDATGHHVIVWTGWGDRLDGPDAPETQP